MSMAIMAVMYTATQAIELQARSETWATAMGDGVKELGDDNYFKNDAYVVKSKEDKVTDLWTMLVPDASVVEGPLPLYWADFDATFT